MRGRVMPAGIAVDTTPATRLPPWYREVGDLIGVNDGKGGNTKVGPRSPEQRHRGGPSSSGRGTSSIRDAGDLSEDDDVGVDPRTPTNRAAPPSYEDALLSSRRVPPKSPPRPGHEHEGEKKKPTTPLRPPSLTPHIPRPYRRVSDLKPSLTVLPIHPITRRGSRARCARVPGPREPVKEVSATVPSPRPARST